MKSEIVVGISHHQDGESKTVMSEDKPHTNGNHESILKVFRDLGLESARQRAQFDIAPTYPTVTFQVVISDTSNPTFG